MSTKKIDVEIEALKAKLAEAEAEKQVEQKKERAALAKAMKHAGENHSRTMLSLYELLGVEPEHTMTRLSRGVEVQVAVDRDETLRSRRLLTLVEGLVAAIGSDVLGGLQQLDHEDRDTRKPQPKTRVEEASVEHQEEQDEDTVGNAFATSYSSAA